jgi:lysophospholipase L1-like esterase
LTVDTFSFLALGDSYTIGEKVQPHLRWPVQLARRLREEGLPVEDPLVIAQTGWTTDELQAALETSAPAGPFHLVSLLIGVNNQYRRREVGEYRREFSALLSRAVGLADGDPGRVVVLSIPDWGVTPFAEGRAREDIAREIDTFNHENREESSVQGVHYVDVTRISREGGDDPNLVAEDGLHPGAAQYAKWAEAVLPTARGILRQADR